MDTEPDVPEPEVPVRPAGPPTLRLRAMLAVAAVLAAAAGGFFWLNVKPPEDPAEVIRSAIRAHGGEEALAKTMIGRYTADVSFERNGVVRGTGKFAELFEFPIRVRRRAETTEGPESSLVEYVTSVDGGWQRTRDGRIVPLAPKADVMGAWNAVFPKLTGLLNVEQSLGVGPGARIDGRDCVGVVVKGPTGGGVLYFDLQTRLIARARMHANLPATGQAFTADIDFSDYAESNGVMMPQRVAVQAERNPTMVFHITSMTFLDRHDDADFDPPPE